jgi:hypothetical protein
LPVPAVTSVSPNTGPTTGSTAVTITGSNFTARHRSSSAAPTRRRSR